MNFVLFDLCVRLDSDGIISERWSPGNKSLDTFWYLILWALELENKALKHICCLLLLRYYSLLLLYYIFKYVVHLLNYISLI